MIYGRFSLNVAQMLFISAALSATSVSSSQEWQKIYGTFNDTEVREYAAGPLKEHEGNMLVELRWGSISPQANASEKSKIETYSIRCPTKIHSIDEVKYYSELSGRGSVLRVEKTSGYLKIYKKGTLSGALIDSVCDSPAYKADRNRIYAVWEKNSPKLKQGPPSRAAEETSKVMTLGSGPVNGEIAAKICTKALYPQILPSGLGMNTANGNITKIEFLSSIDASQVYGSLGPQGRLFPVKLDVLESGTLISGIKAYLSKDAFGEFSCRRA